MPAASMTLPRPVVTMKPFWSGARPQTSTSVWKETTLPVAASSTASALPCGEDTATVPASGWRRSRRYSCGIPRARRRPSRPAPARRPGAPCRPAAAGRFRPLVLAAEPHRAGCVDRSMCRIDSWCSSGASSCFSIKIAAQPVDEDQGRLHGRDVEFGAAEIRMRLDAAIGDRQRAAVAEHQHFVRVHAVGRELADAAKAGRSRRRCRSCRRPSRSRSRLHRAARRRARTAPWPKKCRPAGLVIVSGSTARRVVEDHGEGAGRRANTTERRESGSKVTSWPRSGSGDENRSLPSSDSTATP